MAENTKIQWCEATFNSWHGCVKVSQGCKFCYADKQDSRFGESHWGPNARRRMMSDAYWQQPLKWNKEAAAAGQRRRVFCASMADVFEALPDSHPDAVAVKTARLRLWELIEQTPHLDWLLLTKRPENILRMVPHRWVSKEKENWPHVGWPNNVWLGTSVEDQATADKRIPELLQCPAAVRFVSYEPALGPVNFTQIGLRTVPAPVWETVRKETWIDALGGALYTADDSAECDVEHPALSWVIVGGESGPGARPFHVGWAYDMVRQCKAAQVACFVKQLGAKPYHKERPLTFQDKKAGDMTEWPEDLRVREFPEIVRCTEVAR